MRMPLASTRGIVTPGAIDSTWELNAPSASEEPAGIDGAGAGVAVPGLDGAAGAGAAWPGVH